MSRARHRVVATLVVILASVGCTGEERVALGTNGKQEGATLENPQARADGVTGDSEDGAASDSPNGSSADADPPTTEPRPRASELAGMYGWDPEGGFPNAVLLGTLVVAAPCVYLEVSGTDGAVPEQKEDSPRSLLRLPEPITRYDPGSDAVWVSDDGPMSSGDAVVVTGSEGERIGPNVNAAMRDFAWLEGSAYRYGCPAHGSFWVASMSPLTPGRNEPLDAGGQETWLAGLFRYDLGSLHTDTGADMVLVLEPPCVFVIPVAVWDSREASRQVTHRYLLRLPRPLVRFDAANSSLWVGDHGPMTTGDKVSLNDATEESVYGSEFYEGGCSARGTIRSGWLMPLPGSVADPG